MSRATITLDTAARSVLTGALLQMLAGEAERLTGTLERSDREAHPQRTRNAYDRLHRVGILLNKVGWGDARTPATIAIDPEAQLAIVLAALCEAEHAARLSAEDSRRHGSSREARRAAERAEQTARALHSVEAQSSRLGHRARGIGPAH